MDWLPARVKPLASAVGDAVKSAGLRVAEWGPVQQFLLSLNNRPGIPQERITLESIVAQRAGLAHYALGLKKMASITTIDLLTLATSLPYANQSIGSYAKNVENITIQSFDSSFSAVLGANPSWKLLKNESYQAFHEAGVYIQDTNSLYISSNWANDFSNPINVSILNLNDYSLTSERYNGLFAPNGGTTYVTPGTNDKPQLLFCDEGSFEIASGLTLIDVKGKTSKPVVNNFYHRNFSSVNDVRQHYSTGDLWFTDAQYGYLQSFRPPPSIPNQVYRFEPLTGNIQVAATDFVQSNGLEFSPDFKTMYVTDTGALLVELGTNFTRPATVYAYDVVNGKYLENRRTFAYIDTGVPDGIHCDTSGNVYIGCGDGIQVFNPDGRLIGKFVANGGIATANFAFVPGGLILFQEYRLFLIEIAAVGREIARDFGK